MCDLIYREMSSLNFVIIVHRKLGVEDESSSDAEVLDRILYFYPPHSSQKEQLSRMQMVEAMVEFGARMSDTGMNFITMQDSTVAFYECEPKCWLVASIKNEPDSSSSSSSGSYSSSSSSSAGSMSHSCPYLFNHRPSGSGIISTLKRLYAAFATIHGSILNILKGDDNDGWNHIEVVRIARKRFRKTQIAHLEIVRQLENLEYSMENHPEDTTPQQTERFAQLQTVVDKGEKEVEGLEKELVDMTSQHGAFKYTPYVASKQLSIYFNWCIEKGELFNPSVLSCMYTESGSYLANLSPNVVIELEGLRRVISNAMCNFNDSKSGDDDGDIDIDVPLFDGRYLMIHDGSILMSDFTPPVTASLFDFCRMIDDASVRDGFEQQLHECMLDVLSGDRVGVGGSAAHDDGHDECLGRKSTVYEQLQQDRSREHRRKSSSIFSMFRRASATTDAFAFTAGGGNGKSLDPVHVERMFQEWTRKATMSHGFIGPSWNTLDFGRTVASLQSGDLTLQPGLDFEKPLRMEKTLVEQGSGGGDSSNSRSISQLWIPPLCDHSTGERLGDIIIYRQGRFLLVLLISSSLVHNTTGRGSGSDSDSDDDPTVLSDDKGFKSHKMHDRDRLDWTASCRKVQDELEVQISSLHRSLHADLLSGGPASPTGRISPSPPKFGTSTAGGPRKTPSSSFSDPCTVSKRANGLVDTTRERFKESFHDAGSAVGSISGGGSASMANPSSSSSSILSRKGSCSSIDKDDQQTSHPRVFFVDFTTHSLKFINPTSNPTSFSGSTSSSFAKIDSVWAWPSLPTTRGQLGTRDLNSDGELSRPIPAISITSPSSGSSSSSDKGSSDSQAMFNVTLARVFREARHRYPTPPSFLSGRIEPLVLSALTEVYTSLNPTLKSHSYTSSSQEMLLRVTSGPRGGVWAYGRKPLIENKIVLLVLEGYAKSTDALAAANNVIISSVGEVL